MKKGKYESNIGIHFTDGDDVEVIMFDVAKCTLVGLEDRRHVPLLLLVHEERHELVNDSHVNVSSVVSGNKDLRAGNMDQ
jgi:hypothetical protein